MATTRAATIAGHIGKLVTAQKHRELTDRELLRRFTKDHDESAFSTLLHKHGPMVLNVCQRALHNAHDAEDVFQATFLVLMKKAGALSWRDSAAGWLHEVAYRLAVRAKADALRRGAKERRATAKDPEDPVSELTVREAQACLHEELHRLPESLRAPLVLCYLQGATQDEAARELAWALRTFKRRLERGRSLLQRRLTRRGVTLSVALSTGLLPAAVASAGLIPSTLKAAVALASGKTTGAVPASVSALVDGALRGMFLAKMKVMAGLMLLASVLGTGIAMLGRQPVESPILQAGAAAPGRESAGESAQKSVKPATDRFGDALPEHAVARMGSLRFQHGQTVERLFFSQDGSKILVNGFYGTNRVFDAATGKEHKIAEGFSSSDVCIAGNRVLVVGPKAGQGPTGIWNLETGRLVKAIDVHSNGGSVAPDGKFAALHTRMANATMFRFLELETGRLTEPVRAEGMGQVDHYWFSADGKRLVAVGLTGNGRSCTAWDVATGKLLQNAGVGEQPLTWVSCFSPDGTTIGNISGQRDQVDLHDVMTLRLTATFKAPAKTTLYTAAISPDGSLVAAASGSTFYLWDRTTGKEVRRIPGRGWMDRVITFSPDGKRLAAAEHNSISQYDVATGAPCHTFGHTYAIYSLRFAPDGKKLYSIAVYRDSSVRVWNPLTGELLEELKGHTKGLSSMAMSPDGRWLVTSSQDRTIRLWDRPLAKERVCLDEKTWGHFLAFLTDGKRFVSASEHEVRLHDAATGEIAATFEVSETARGLFTNASTLWAEVSQSNVLLAIDLASGKVARKLNVPEDRHRRYALTADGKRIAVGTDKGTVHVIDTSTGDEYRQLKIKDDGTNQREVPTGLAFSADGELLAVGSRRGMVSLWEMGSGKERVSFPGHRSEVLCLAFSPDRKLLASGGSDQTILAWDLYGTHGNQKSNSTPTLLDKLWDDLRHPDPAQAYPAIKGFAANAAATTAYFAKKHQPTPKVEDKVLRLWIEHLDSDNFKLREEGFRKLKSAVRQAEPLLQAALAKNPSLDFSRRVQQILAELDPAQSPDCLRWVRAAEILRVLDTPAARALLRAIER